MVEVVYKERDEALTIRDAVEAFAFRLLWVSDEGAYMGGSH